mmetsp:Transcript_6022/g.13876  ORF Transcript_6022/g.13876 Transcript_6022/m.13876 type:complete len:253 (-) Transcript_6022:109-867(-)
MLPSPFRSRREKMLIASSSFRFPTPASSFSALASSSKPIWPSPRTSILSKSSRISFSLRAESATSSGSVTRPLPKGSSMACPISSVTNKIHATNATIGGTRTGDVSLTSANGSVRVNMEKKREVCLEYERGRGVVLIFSHWLTTSVSLLIWSSTCSHTGSRFVYLGALRSGAAACEKLRRVVVGMLLLFVIELITVLLGGRYVLTTAAISAGFFCPLRCCLSAMGKAAMCAMQTSSTIPSRLHSVMRARALV